MTQWLQAYQYLVCFLVNGWNIKQHISFTFCQFTILYVKHVLKPRFENVYEFEGHAPPILPLKLIHSGPSGYVYEALLVPER